MPRGRGRRVAAAGLVLATVAAAAGGGTVVADEHDDGLEDPDVVDDDYGETTVSWRLPNRTTATGETVAVRFDAGESVVEATATDEFGAAATATVAVVAESAGTGGVGGVVALAALLLAGAVARRR